MTTTPDRRGQNLTTVALAGACALLALLLGAASAPAATKDYSMNVAPSNLLGGRTVAVSATLTNLTKTQRLGSADITPPATYSDVTVTSLSLPAPATATVAGGVVQVRELSLRPKTSVTVNMTATTPCSPDSSTWGVVAKQANDFSGSPGNNLLLDPTQSSVTTTIGACVPCPEDASCTATLGVPGGSQDSVTADPSATQPDVGSLGVSGSIPLDCAGYAERSNDAFVLDGPQNRPKTGVLTFAANTRPVTTRDPLEVCYAAPQQFAVKPKTTQTMMVIDGELNYVGRLPNCLGFSPPPCVTGRDDAARSIEFTMPAGDPHNM